MRGARCKVHLTSCMYQLHATEQAPQFKEVVTGWTDAKVVVNGCVITSQGPGTSLQFALKIVEQLYGVDKAEELAAALLTQRA